MWEKGTLRLKKLNLELKLSWNNKKGRGGQMHWAPVLDKQSRGMILPELHVEVGPVPHTVLATSLGTDTQKGLCILTVKFKRPICLIERLVLSSPPPSLPWICPLSWTNTHLHFYVLWPKHLSLPPIVVESAHEHASTGTRRLAGAQNKWQGQWCSSESPYNFESWKHKASELILC